MSKKKIKSVKRFFPQTKFLSLIVRKDKKNIDKELLDTDARLRNFHCVKSVQIRSFSGPYFPVFRQNTEDGIRRFTPCSVRIWENTDQKKLYI